MNIPRNLIWIALLGFSAVLFFRIEFHNKRTAIQPKVCEVGKVRLKLPVSPRLAPPIPSEPATNTIQTSGQSGSSSEPSPAVAFDPEKIAAIINSFSEAEAYQCLQKLTMQDLTGNTGRLLIRRWAELNPTAAVNWATQLTDVSVRQEMIDVIALAWSEKDLPNALAWVKSLPEDATKSQALTDLGYELGRVNPIEAMRLAIELPSGEKSETLLVYALTQYASTDPSQSQQLALALPQGSLRDQALATVATVQAQQDGAGAARFAVENIPPGPDLDRAVMGVVQLWGQNSLYDAIIWTQSFPDSPLRNQAAQSLNAIPIR